MNNIRILEGTYKIRGKDVDLSGMVFPLVEEFKVRHATKTSYTKKPASFISQKFDH